MTTVLCLKRKGILDISIRLEAIAIRLGARTLLVAPGIATSNKKLLGTKGIATRSKNAIRLEAIATRKTHEKGTSLLGCGSVVGGKDAERQL